MFKYMYIIMLSIGVYANGTEPISEENKKENVSHDHIVFFDVKFDVDKNIIINQDLHTDYNDNHEISVSKNIIHNHDNFSKGFVAKLKRYYIDANKNGKFDKNETIKKYEMVETFFSKATVNDILFCEN